MNLPRAILFDLDDTIISAYRRPWLAGRRSRASYDVELKEDYTAHVGYVRASVPF